MRLMLASIWLVIETSAMADHFERDRIDRGARVRCRASASWISFPVRCSPCKRDPTFSLLRGTNADRRHGCALCALTLQMRCMRTVAFDADGRRRQTDLDDRADGTDAPEPCSPAALSTVAHRAVLRAAVEAEMTNRLLGLGSGRGPPGGWRHRVAALCRISALCRDDAARRSSRAATSPDYERSTIAIFERVSPSVVQVVGRRRRRPSPRVGGGEEGPVADRHRLRVGCGRPRRHQRSRGRGRRPSSRCASRPARPCRPSSSAPRRTTTSR